MTPPKTLTPQEALRAIADERVKLENEIYGVLCKYLPQYERRGFNFHPRAQTIAAFAGKQFVEWAQANLQIEVGTK